MKKFIIVFLIINIFIFTLSPLSVLAAKELGSLPSVRMETEGGTVYYRPDYISGTPYLYPIVFLTKDGYMLAYLKGPPSVYPLQADGRFKYWGLGIVTKTFTNLKDLEFELFETGVDGTFEGYRDPGMEEIYVYQTIFMADEIIPDNLNHYTGSNGDPSIVMKSLDEYYAEYRKRNPVSDEPEIYNEGKYIICQYNGTINKDDVENKKNPNFGYALIKVPDCLDEVKQLNQLQKLDLMSESWFVNSAIDIGHYVIRTHSVFDISYNPDDKFSIYTFDSLTDAVRYQLFNELPDGNLRTGFSDHYAVNITEFLYSNVKVGEFYNPINVSDYQSKDNYIIFRQKDTNCYFKVYFEFRPWTNAIFKDSKGRYAVRLPNEQFAWVRVYEGWFDEDGNSIMESDSADGWDIVPEDDEYYHNKRQWHLYSPEAEEQFENEILHEVVYSTNSTHMTIFNIDDNSVSMSDELPIHVLKDEDGNKYILNSINDSIVKEDDFSDPYIYDEESGLYIDKDGNTIDINDLTDLTQDWLDQQSLEVGFVGIIQVFYKFTEILNEFKVYLRQAAEFITSAIKTIPKEIISLISLAVFTLIIIRLVRQRE